MAKAKEIISNDPVEITPEGSIVPVFLVPLTDAEIAEREQWIIDQTAREQAEADKAAARESAMAKLAELGLTVDEINAAFNLS